MKVLIVYHVFAHYREPILRELAQSREHEYVFYSGDVSNQVGLRPLDEVRLNTSTSIPIFKLRNRWFKQRFLWQKGLVRRLLIEDYDAVVFLGNFNFISVWVGSVLVRLRSKKILMWTHGLYGSEGSAIRRLRCCFYRLAHGLLLYGNHAKSLLENNGFNSGRLCVIYNSLDVVKQNRIYFSISSQEASNVVSLLFQAKAIPTILFIGRLTFQKKISALLHSVAELRDIFPVNLLLIGDGELRGELEELVSKLGIKDNVYFYGASFDEVENAKLIYASDVCVAPGEVGLTAMHTLVYGTPVITHDNPDNQMPEYEAVVSGVSGSFYREDDYDDLTEKIYSWLNQDFDRSLIRENCRQVIQDKYNPIAQRKFMDQFINSICS